MFLPRNVDVCEVEQLSWLSSPPLNVEVITYMYSYLIAITFSFLCKLYVVHGFQIEENYVHGFLKGKTAYFGNVAY